MSRHKPDHPKSPHSRTSAGRVRIIAGQWRGRVVEFIDAEGLRPSGDRIRETLFNWLQYDLAGARCLDLYAGSGVLGFEALSRGAASLTMVEKNPQVVATLNQQVEILGTNLASVVNQSAEDFLETTDEIYDLVFIDPPFALAEQLVIVNKLVQAETLSPGALIYIEAPNSQQIVDELPTGLMVLRSKQAGNVQYHLLKSEIG